MTFSFSTTNEQVQLEVFFASHRYLSKKLDRTFKTQFYVKKVFEPQTKINFACLEVTYRQGKNWNLKERWALYLCTVAHLPYIHPGIAYTRIPLFLSGYTGPSPHTWLSRDCHTPAKHRMFRIETRKTRLGNGKNTNLIQLFMGWTTLSTR